MKNSRLVKNNQLSKINWSHPYSYKEINPSTNYLYMQIRNGLNKNRNNNKNNSNSYSNSNKNNLSNIKNKSKQKYSFYNQNKAKSSKNKASYSQNTTNINLDNSILNKNKSNDNNNRNRNNSENNISKNNKDNSFTDNTYKPKKNVYNKIERNKTPISRINNNMRMNNIYKISPLDNSIILSSSSLFSRNHGSQKNLNFGISPNMRIINKNSKNNIINNNKNGAIGENNLFQKKLNNNHRSFQPKNIFAQFKKKKKTNTTYGFGFNNILLNNNKNNNNKLLLTGTLLEENKSPNINKLNKTKDKSNIEKININPQNNVFQSQTQNSIKTNDSSALQINGNSNLSNGTASNNNISSAAQIVTNSNFNINHFNQSLNIDCHEINISLSGIPKKEESENDSNLNIIKDNDNNINVDKPKVWKGKKIKCMHDISKTGLSGDDKKVNQDNYFIFKNFVQGFENIYMGVCDGHGYYGHEVSGFIKENLPMNLNHSLKKKNIDLMKDDLTVISPIIKTCFVNENKNLLKNRQIDSDLSGTTCISVIYTPKKLIIANIGDSRCVLGKCKNNKWSSENLSRDHKPTIPEEAERILKVGGRIHPMRDDDGDFIGPLRVYMKDKEMPGLAMTRSFGDYFGSTAGTISEPEVTEHILSEEDKFIVIASDGLYEFIESEEVVEYVREFYEKNDIVGCCEFLYKESCRKWLDEEEDAIDDITIILVFFEDYYE